MSKVIATASSGPGGSYGMTSSSPSDNPSTIRADQCVFKGSTCSIIIWDWDDYATLYVGASKLDGPVGPVGDNGEYNCVYSYDGNYQELDSSCKIPPPED